MNSTKTELLEQVNTKSKAVNANHIDYTWIMLSMFLGIPFLVIWIALNNFFIAAFAFIALYAAIGYFLKQE